MCMCTPEIKTPFCGKGNCQWPKQKKFLVVYNPTDMDANYPQNEITIECETVEEAFLKTVELKRFGNNIRVYKRILIKVEVTQ